MPLIIVKNDVSCQTNDNGPAHIPGAGCFSIPGGQSLVNTKARIDGLEIVVNGQSYNGGCCVGTLGVPDETHANKHARIDGHYIILEGDTGSSSGPHTLTGTISYGQNHARINLE